VNIKDIKGLKYPDEYFIKFFFKHQLHTKENLTFLELGCSNGCNLMLAYQYGHNTLGVELDNTLVEYANHNFKLLNQKNMYKFYQKDMREFTKTSNNLQADVLVLASSIYYIDKQSFIDLLKDIINNKLIKENTLLFIRFREVDDFRNNKGKEIEKNSIIMKNSVTGEDGIFCKFYDTYEMIEILKSELNLKEYQTMNLRYDNIQNNTKVSSSEVVIWGVIN
jgi:SAM-dependent methyltransferase